MLSGDQVINIRPSRMAVGCHLFASCLALAGGCLSALSGLTLMIWCALIAAAAIYGVWSLSKRPVLNWLVYSDGLYRLDDQGERVQVLVRRSWQLAPWLVLLSYRIAGQHWRSVLVWPDSADSETRRLLRSRDWG